MCGKVVLGLGGTVDYELEWDSAVIHQLITRWSITCAELEHDTPIESERALLITILQMMRNNRGGEFYVPNRDVLTAFASHFTYRVTLGGTGVREALAMSRVGIPSLVHLVSISEEVRELLPPTVDYISSATKDSLDPHIIVQYPHDEIIQLGQSTIVTKRPNRLIFVNDQPNENLELSDRLEDAIVSAPAVLISGFNTMKSRELLELRLQDLTRILLKLRDDIPIVYEDAGFHDDSMRALVNSYTKIFASIHSLNEEEAQLYVGQAVNWSDPVEVGNAVLRLKELLGARTVCVHTAQYSATYGEHADLVCRAAMVGHQMASTRFSYGDSFTYDDYVRVSSAAMTDVGTQLARSRSLSERGIKIAPSRTITVARPTTIGLGDSFIGGMMLELAAMRGLSVDS